MRLLALLIVIVFAQVAAAEIAVVVQTTGEVTRTDATSTQTPLKRRDTLSEGDTISTGAGASVTLKFSDQSVIDLGEQTSLVLATFQPEQETAQRKILLELLSGQLRTLTGSLASEPNAYELRTAHASIGVRGTEFEVHIVSNTETQVQWHTGTVLVHSLEFPEEVLTLTAEAQKASVKVGSPAVLIQAMSANSLGVLGNALLESIAGVAAPPLIPVVPPVPVAVPMVVALDNDGAAPVNSSADSLEPIEALVSLVQLQQWAQARILANELKERFEGLPRFDLYHGLLLMSEQQYDEAIFSFERVLFFTPEQHRARLELGRAYYLTQNYQRARTALLQVMDANPPAAVQTNVKTLLKRVDEAEKSRQAKTHIGVSVTVGWDSNYNGGSNFDEDKETLAPNLLALTRIADASKPKSSLFTQWSINTGQTEPTSQNSSSQLSVDFTQRQLTEAAELTTQALTLQGAINSQSDTWRTRLPASLQWSHLAGKPWQATVDVSLQQQAKVWGPLWAGVKVGTQMSASLADANNSSVKDMAGIAFDVVERGLVHSLSSVYLQHSQAGEDDGHAEWRGLSNRYHLAWSHLRTVQVHFAIEHQWRRYREADLLFTVNNISTEGIVRNDHVFNGNLQVGWAPTGWLQTLSQINGEWVNSNVNAYGRDRWSASQSVSIQF